MARTEFKANHTMKAMGVSTSLNVPMMHVDRAALCRLRNVFSLKLVELQMVLVKGKDNQVGLIIQLPQGLRQMEISNRNTNRCIIKYTTYVVFQLVVLHL